MLDGWKRIVRGGMLLGAMSLSAHAEPVVYVIGSLRAEPYQETARRIRNTLVPQVGGLMEYRTPWVAPAGKATVGWIRGSWMSELFLGLGSGFDGSGFRPSLALGMGLLSDLSRNFSRKDEGNAVERYHYGFYGAEARVEAFQTLFGGVTTRFGRYKVWSMEIGYRLGRP